MQANAFNAAIAKFLQAKGFPTHEDQGHTAVNVPTDPSRARELAELKLPLPCDRHIHESKVFFVQAGDPRAPMNSMSTDQFVENVVRRNDALAQAKKAEAEAKPKVAPPAQPAADPDADDDDEDEEDEEDAEDAEPVLQSKQPEPKISGDAAKP